MLEKNILIIADLGAAGNLFRNVLLIHEFFDWPLTIDRVTAIQQQYSQNMTLPQWLPQEHQLRFFSQAYGVDLSNNIDVDHYYRCLKQSARPIIFFNHSAFWQQDQLPWLFQTFHVLYIAPETDFGCRWQIRSYVEKRSVQNLQDFCYVQDRSNQIQKYVSQYGHDSYYEINITNMYHIIRERQIQFRSLIDDGSFFPLEIFLYNDSALFVSKIQQRLGIDLDQDCVHDVVSSWQNLHWPIEDTPNWLYNHLLV